MSKHKGQFSTIFTVVMAVILLVASAVLFAGAVKRRTEYKQKLLPEKAIAESHISTRTTHDENVELDEAEICKIEKRKELLRTMIEIALEHKDFKTAEEFTEELLELDPSNAEAQYNLGKMQIKENDLDAAKEQIQKLHNMRTEETRKYAEELKELLKKKSVPGIFDDTIGKIFSMNDEPNNTSDETDIEEYDNNFDDENIEEELDIEQKGESIDSSDIDENNDNYTQNTDENDIYVDGDDVSESSNGD